MIGFTMGSCEAAAVVSRLLMGRRMDRIGRKKVLQVGAAMTALASFLFCAVTSAGVLPILLRVLLGVGYGAFFTACFTIAAALSPRDRLAEGLGTLGLSALVAQGFAPSLGERLVGTYGFTALFIAAGTFSVAALLLSLVMRESKYPDFCLMYRNGITAEARKALIVILVVAFFHAAGRGAIVSFFSDFAYDRGLRNAGTFFAFFGAAAFIGRLLGGRLIDRVGRARMLVPSLILFAAGLYYIPLIHTMRAVAAGGALCGLGQAFLYPVLMSLALGAAHVCDLGLITGLFTACFDAGLGFGAFFWGAIANYWDYPTMYVTAGTLVVLMVFSKNRIR
jgi:predicted MFS family arabinose efflux permease